MTWKFGPVATVALMVFTVASIRVLIRMYRLVEVVNGRRQMTWELSTVDRWVLFVYAASALVLCYGIARHV